MTVVEIDPEVTKTARLYFNLKDDQRLTIINEDARIFINNNLEKYDAIYGDAFASYFSIPFQLTTKEAIQKIYNGLNDNGIFALNLISSLEGKKSQFFKAEYKTVSQIFPQVYIFPAQFYNPDDAAKTQNIVLIATKNPIRLTKEELINKANADQKTLLDQYWQQPMSIDSSVKILTDDFAPVDYYISKLL